MSAKSRRGARKSKTQTARAAKQLPADTVYVILPERSGEDAISLRLLPGRVLVDDLSHCDVQLLLNGQTVRLPTPRVFVSREEGRRALQAARPRLTLEQTLTTVGFGLDTRTSTNPLRFGEPNVTATIQSSLVDQKVLPERDVQYIAAISDDIEILQTLLHTLDGVADYPKKLLGKYIVLELHSMFGCLRNLSTQLDEYAVEFGEFSRAVAMLEEQYGFRTIRNKIAAHRDGALTFFDAVDVWRNVTAEAIDAYVQLFVEHLPVVERRFGVDTHLHWALRNRPLEKMVVRQPPDNPYVPFDRATHSYGLSIAERRALASEEPQGEQSAGHRPPSVAKGVTNE